MVGKVLVLAGRCRFSGCASLASVIKSVGLQPTLGLLAICLASALQCYQLCLVRIYLIQTATQAAVGVVDGRVVLVVRLDAGSAAVELPSGESGF